MIKELNNKHNTTAPQKLNFFVESRIFEEERPQ